jgi:hypothetical protein
MEYDAINLIHRVGNDTLCLTEHADHVRGQANLWESREPRHFLYLHHLGSKGSTTGANDRSMNVRRQVKGHSTHRCKVTGKYLCSIVSQLKYLGYPLDEVDAYMPRHASSIVKRGCVIALVPSLDLVGNNKQNTH